MGKSILSGCPAWAGPIYIPAVTIYSNWMCKKSEATSQAKICTFKIWWLPARHEISGSLKRQAIKIQCLFMLVCVRVLKMLTLARENSVFGVKTCSLILFGSTLKISRLK